MKKYSGITIGKMGSVRQVWVDEDGSTDLLYPAPSQALRNHSPDGFNWGYGGSGPAQLALAILLDHTGNPETAELYYQDFKNDHVAKWEDTWAITGDQVEAWLIGKQEQSL